MKYRALFPVNPPECEPGAEVRIQFVWDEECDCELQHVEALDAAAFEVLRWERGDGRDHSKLSLSARPSVDEDDAATLVGGIGVPESALLVVTVRNRSSITQRADARAIVHVVDAKIGAHEAAAEAWLHAR